MIRSGRNFISTFAACCLLGCLSFGAEYLPAGSLLQQKDSIRNNQVLYNGKIWRNLYQGVSGTQFLFTGDFMLADISVKGQTFRNVRSKYDIYKDELIVETNHGILIQMNKEIVDSFSLVFSPMVYKFIRIDSAMELNGFVNVLYSGRSMMYVKHRKLIELLAINNRQDRFYESKKMFLVQNGIAEQFSGKADLLKLFGERKREVKELIRKDRLYITRDDPNSFIPVIKLYDKLILAGQ